MKAFFNKVTVANFVALAIFACTAFLGLATADRQIWAQAPIKGEVSTGVYKNVAVGADGKLLTTGTYSGTQTVNIGTMPNVTISAINATFSTTAVTVTSGVTAISPADAARTYFQIQNNHATGFISVSESSSVTTTTGTKVLPGQAYAPLVPPKSAMYAIGDVASNTSVIVVTGK